MRTTYTISRRRKITLVVVIVLGSIALPIVSYAFGLWIESTGWSYSNMILWLAVVVLSSMTAFLSKVVRYAWRVLRHGIAVEEGGISVYGEDLDWQEISVVYTNPDRRSITLFATRPTRRLPLKEIYKRDIPELDGFLTQLQEFGVDVRNENLEISRKDIKKMKRRTGRLT